MDHPTPTETRAAVDTAETVRWLEQSLRMNSVTGNEKRFAEFVRVTLEGLADTVQTVEVESGRPLVWSYTRGYGCSPTTLLVAHLDTVAPSDPRRLAESVNSDPFSPKLIDGELWGLGAADDKGGIASAVAALRALRRLGIRPAGDVVTLWVPDEESGQPGHGRSTGMRRAVDLIRGGAMPRPDFAIYLEPTSLDVYAAQVGFLIGEIKVTGAPAYWASPDDGSDALKAAVEIYGALSGLGEMLRTRPAHRLLGPPVLVVHEMHSGQTVSVPGTARLSFIRSVPPSEDLDRAAEEISAVVADSAREAGVTAQIEFPDGRDHPFGGQPSEADAGSPTVLALCAAIQAFRPDRGQIGGARFWSELSFFKELDIPGVYLGAGTIDVCHTEFERVPLSDIHALAAALALFLTTAPKTHAPSTPERIN